MNGTLQRTQNLASLFRSAAAALTFSRTKTSAARRKRRAHLSSPSSSDDVRLKGYISSVKPSSHNTKHESHQRLLLAKFKAPPSSPLPNTPSSSSSSSSSPVPNSSLGSIVCGSLTSDCVDKDGNMHYFMPIHQFLFLPNFYILFFCHR